MRKLIKDSEGNVAELMAVDPSFIPTGWTEVPAEEVDAEELTLARKYKMDAVRAKRNAWLLINDKEWLIAAKKNESTAGLEADAVALRDLPEAAETALDALSSVEDVEAYDAFAGLSLSVSYE